MPRQYASSSPKRVAGNNWEGSDGSFSGSFDDEQDEQTSTVQGHVFQQYLELCEEFGPEDDNKDAIFAAGLARVAEYLNSSRDATTCLICLGTIKPVEAVWQCSGGCHAILHLPCVQDWARTQLEASVLRATTTAAAERAPLTVEQARAAAEWGCPKCRHSYARRDMPSSYTCFCGKAPDPEWDPWLAPHTCGEVCGKTLPGTSCGHTCTLLCHPGPCPPCPRVVTAPCHCGKLRLRQRCSQAAFSCAELCGRRLGCGHACPEVCHEGPCPPCQQVSAFRCACGAEAAQRPCSQQVWHCARPCGKPLACGRHTCQLVCHAGPACPPCAFSGARTCPCGKTPYPDLPCDQASPSCGSTCGKLLSCGVHSCVERCHTGPCPAVCRDMVTKTCRCGQTSRAVQCHQEVLCERRCNAVKACGRHPCKRRCCDGDHAACEEMCNRKLRCNNHKCPAPCHTGPCRPCPLTSRVSCACGTTQYSLVCGAESQAVAPRCPRPCPVPLLCRHAATARPHRCHYGPCPGCHAACGTPQPCGHTCSSSTCHDQPPPAVAGWQQPLPPKSVDQAAAPVGKKAAARAAAKERDPGEGLHPAHAAAAAAKQQLGPAASPPRQQPPTWTACPACEVPVGVTCVGGHQQRQVACSRAGPFSCGEPCGQPLPCGHHTCSKPCHAVQGAAGTAAGGGQGQPCESCKRPCSQPRACAHPCPLPCHPQACPPCKVTQACLCHCGKTRLQFPCHQYAAIQAGSAETGGAAAGAAGAQGDPLRCSKPCHRELPGCRHPCKALCHSGPCPEPQQCSEEVSVRCECRRLKEKWPCYKVQAALAAGGGSREYDGTVSQRLLQCDAECRAAAAAKAKTQPAASSAGAAMKAAAEPAPTAAAAAAAAKDASASSKPSTKKMSRAEREALQAARVAEQLKAELWARRKRQARQYGVPLLVVVVLVLLTLGVFRAMEVLDKRARQVWAPDAGAQSLEL